MSLTNQVDGARSLELKDIAPKVEPAQVVFRENEDLRLRGAQEASPSPKQANSPAPTSTLSTAPAVVWNATGSAQFALDRQLSDLLNGRSDVSAEAAEKVLSAHQMRIAVATLDRQEKLLAGWKDPYPDNNISQAALDRLVTRNDAGRPFIQAALEEFIGSSPERRKLIEGLANHHVQFTTLPRAETLGISVQNFAGVGYLAEQKGDDLVFNGRYVYLNPRRDDVTLADGVGTISNELTNLLPRIIHEERQKLQIGQPLEAINKIGIEMNLDQEVNGYVVQALRDAEQKAHGTASAAQLERTLGDRAMSSISQWLPGYKPDGSAVEKALVYMAVVYGDIPLAPDATWGADYIKSLNDAGLKLVTTPQEFEHLSRIKETMAPHYQKIRDLFVASGGNLEEQKAGNLAAFQQSVRDYLAQNHLTSLVRE